MRSFINFIGWVCLIGILCVYGMPFYEKYINNKTLKCNENQLYLNSVVSDWMKDMILPKYTISITKFDNFYELESSPKVLGTTLYEDIKNSHICKATAHIQLKDDKGHQIEDSIDIRYQHFAYISDDYMINKTGIIMSSYDTKNLREYINQKIMELVLKSSKQDD